jgi:hypothetical protein
MKYKGKKLISIIYFHPSYQEISPPHLCRRIFLDTAGEFLTNTAGEYPPLLQDYFLNLTRKLFFSAKNERVESGGGGRRLYRLSLPTEESWKSENGYLANWCHTKP